MSRLRLLGVLLLSSILLAGCIATPNPDNQVTSADQDIKLETLSMNTTTTNPTAQPQPESDTPMEKITATTATIKTSKGDITIELYADKAPQTVQNFLNKAKSDFYKNLKFHRVEDWVVQGGDPLGNGTGGGKMATELNDAPFKIGSVGVARGGDIRVSNDAQFFICTKDCSWLDGQYTNFGMVTEGMEIVNSLKIGDTIAGITYE
jgi:peptidyl-prolyl cis-trans isomerase B (cyclophilin B)